MYSVKAQVLNTFSVPATEKYPASWKVQLLGDNHFQDGQVKKEMLTLNVPESIFSSLQDKAGKIVSLPVSFFVSNGRLQTIFPKNIKLPEVKVAA